MEWGMKVHLFWICQSRCTFMLVHPLPTTLCHTKVLQREWADLFVGFPFGVSSVHGWGDPTGQVCLVACLTVFQYLTQIIQLSRALQVKNQFDTANSHHAESLPASHLSFSVFLGYVLSHVQTVNSVSQFVLSCHCSTILTSCSDQLRLPVSKYTHQPSVLTVTNKSVLHLLHGIH